MAHSGWYDRTTRRVSDLSCGNARVYLEFEVRRIPCRRCGKVKRERLDFLADNPFYTKRFAWFRLVRLKLYRKTIGSDYERIRNREESTTRKERGHA